MTRPLLFFLLSLALLLGGCETLVGVQKDLHTVGRAMQGAAHKVEASLNE